jgi:signal transduction histidine kinase
VVQSGRAAHVQQRDAPSGRVWSLNARLLEGPSPAAARVILDARDITREIELQEDLRRGEILSAMGSLVAGVAHEVRNPLFSISSNIDAFEAQLGARQEFAGMVAVLRSEVARLSSLMQDLLDYGRPPSADREIAPVEDVVREALERCQPLARGISVALPGSNGTLTPVPMDRNRLGLVFRNLIENAVQHSPAQGQVAVSVGPAPLRERDLVEIRVEDRGPGFKDEDLPQIFTPFFTRRRGGTGLGLSIVHKVVLEHGGMVAARNRPGGGASLSVTLPRAPGAAPEGR